MIEWQRRFPFGSRRTSLFRYRHNPASRSATEEAIGSGGYGFKAPWHTVDPPGGRKRWIFPIRRRRRVSRRRLATGGETTGPSPAPRSLQKGAGARASQLLASFPRKREPRATKQKSWLPAPHRR